MKKLILICLSCCLLATTLEAQVPTSIKDTTDKKSQMRDYLKKTLPQSNFSHKTSTGNIYILPYDNMPCLVPDMNNLAKMPNSIERFPESRMPNAIPRRQLIPKPNNNKKSP